MSKSSRLARRMSLGSLAVAAAAAMAAMTAGPAAAAPAAEGPGYRCQVLVTDDLPYAEGFGCEALGGAPEQGPIFGSFTIQDRNGQTVKCETTRPFSGFAETPDRVEGRFCHFPS